jgi:DNA replication protein DnaC
MSVKDQLPARFRDANLDEIDRGQFEFVFEYRANLHANVRDGYGLLVSGPAGVGKTRALAALTVAYARRATKMTSWHFETVPELLEKYRPLSVAQPRDEFRSQSWTETYETVRWLVLNDLGKEYRAGKMHEQQVQKLGRLLRLRTERRLVTHITTNLPLYPKVGVASFEAVYGESIWSLVHECMGGYDVWGEDRRMARSFDESLR